MYRSIGHNGDKKRRTFNQSDPGRVNSQVFDMRAIKEEATTGDFQASKSDGMMHAEKERDKDKRKQHLSKTSNRSSLYVGL